MSSCTMFARLNNLLHGRTHFRQMQNVLFPSTVTSTSTCISSSGLRRLHCCCVCQNRRCLQTFFHKAKISSKMTNSRRYKSNSNSKKDRQDRAKVLMAATYGSLATGGVLFLVFIWREVEKGRQRMKGIERIKDPLLGSKPKLILYKDVMLPNFMEKTIPDIEKFKVRPDDVWIVSFPRSGTTWTQEIVYLIHSDMDILAAQTQTLEERFPYFEFIYPGIKALTAQPSPRLLKTHLPYRLLPKDIHEKKPKIIYIARNPKDVCVSYFHFVELLKPAFGFTGNFNQFFDRFISHKVPYSPWYRHVTEFWEVKDEPNILYLKYEDMINDLEGNIKKIADFLDKPLNEKQAKMIANYCSFNHMQKNNNVNFSWWREYGICDRNGPPFIRKGKIGQWTRYLTPEMNLKIDQMLAMKVQNTGLAFYHGGTAEDLKTEVESDNTAAEELQLDHENSAVGEV